MHSLHRIAKLLHGSMHDLSLKTPMLNGFPKGKCDYASTISLVVLYRNDFKGVSYINQIDEDYMDNHVWLEYMEYCIDLTIDQFTNEIPLVSDGVWQRTNFPHSSSNSITDSECAYVKCLELLEQWGLVYALEHIQARIDASN